MVDSRQHDILKGQCLKIASDYWSDKMDIDNPEHRDRLYQSALVLLKELELKGFMRW